MFKNALKKGPKLGPVKSMSPWTDTRPAPNSAHNGRYTPVLDVRPAAQPEPWCCVMPAPKKPRGTV